MSRRRMIRLLTEHGHSAAMALRIAIDHERGDSIAREWVRTVEAARAPVRP